MPADEFAAVIVEPIQGEGGYVVPEDDFLPRLRELCDRHGILLIADEVQSGAGRTGKMWAIQHWDVEPDILLTAKGIASGMPIGAMIAKAGPDDLGTRRPRQHVRRQPGRAGGAPGDGPAARGRPHRQRRGSAAARSMDGLRPLLAAAPGARQGRPRQGPDDRRSSSTPARRPRPSRCRRSTAGCWSSRRATTACGCRRRSSCRRPRPRPRSGSSARPSTTSRRIGRRGAPRASTRERQAGLITEGFGASG